MSFKFRLKRKVAISASGETGEVIGQAHFANAEDSFLVRYKAGDDQVVERWWTEQAIEAVE
jgi:hypothetical protein